MITRTALSCVPVAAIAASLLCFVVSCESNKHRGETVLLAEPAYYQTAVPADAAAHDEAPSRPVRLSSLNGLARVLGGIEGGESIGSGWTYHQRQMDALWRTHELGRGQHIRTWAASQISDLQHHGSVFYPFSGPDFLFAHELFPYAGSYILCGLETIEPLPDVATLTPGDIAVALDRLRYAINDLMQAGYFVSKDMRSTLKSSRFQGVLPIFLALLARTGNSVTGVSNVGANGVLVRFSSPSGGARRLYYFRQDLSNSGLGGGSFLNFVSGHGRPPAMIKSASYLMHNNDFSKIRDYLVRNSSGIIQDPSGVPFRDLVAAGMAISLYGNYRGTLGIFSHQQPDLAEAYHSGRYPVSSVNFGFGYLYTPSSTSIIVARR